MSVGINVDLSECFGHVLECQVGQEHHIALHVLCNTVIQPTFM